MQYVAYLFHTFENNSKFTSYELIVDALHVPRCKPSMHYTMFASHNFQAIKGN